MKNAIVRSAAIVFILFGALFPGATDVKWAKEGDKEFEAEFKIGETIKSSNFDPAGKWLVTETVVKSTDLPAVVQATITNEFPGFKIEEAETLETAEAGMIYEVALEKDELNYEVQISVEGKVLKKLEKK